MPLRFGPFRFDAASRQLLRGADEVRLPPRLFKLLEVLLENRPRALSKEELIEKVWPDVVVEEGNLKTSISQLRHALDDGQAENCIRTVHRFGYAFAADVVDASADEGSSTVWQLVRSDGTRIVLGARETIIGRDPHCTLWLDVDGISRRHARLRLDGGTAILEDLGSKNGTYVNGTRITAPTLLHDGDCFLLGSVELEIRLHRADQSTATVDGKAMSR